MPNPNLRVIIPKNPKLLLELAATIFQKHTDDGTASPLNNLQDYNWTDNGPKIADAQNLQLQIEEIERGLESLYEQRNLLIEPITNTVKSSRDTLLGINGKNPKKLGDWGFTVDDTPKASKDKPGNP